MMKTTDSIYLFILPVTVLSIMLLSSCEKNDVSGDSEFSIDKVCYINKNDISGIAENASYYAEIDEAVSNNELLATKRIDSRNTLKYYATRDIFICGGDCFGTFNPTNYGRFENTITSSVDGYQIVNSNTIAKLNLVLLVDEEFCSGQDYVQLKTVYRGTNYKSISWYMKVTYYTYVENDGKLVLSNGVILTESNDTLIPDGGSTRYVKYYLSSLK